MSGTRSSPISGRTRGRCGRSCRSRACASSREGKRRDGHPLSHPLVSRNRTAESLSRYAPRRTRTPSLLIRSQALYPVELWALGWSTVNGLWYETHSGEQLSRNSPSCSLCPGTRCASVHLLLLTTLQPCMGGTRLELVTSTMSTWRSNQLS